MQDPVLGEPRIDASIDEAGEGAPIGGTSVAGEWCFVYCSSLDHTCTVTTTVCCPGSSHEGGSGLLLMLLQDIERILLASHCSCIGMQWHGASAGAPPFPAHLQ